MARRPIRIANCSGAINDGINQIYELAKAGGIDAITGDYLAEFNIAWRAIEQETDPSKGYEPGFLAQLAYHDGDAARLVAEKKIKIVNDGGALNPRGLAEAVDAYFRQTLGITTVRVAWVAGDDLTAALRAGSLDGTGTGTGGGGDVAALGLAHLDQPGVVLTEAETREMLAANAYTGLAGVRRALAAGADIVVCGRCTDASPVMGLAAWWHGWDAEAYDALAGALVAGHLTECGPYVTGGNCSAVYELAQIHDLGWPIAEVAADGSCVVTKNAGTGGGVTRDTVTAQLVYEVQGPRYLNPDVTAHLETAQLAVEADGPDRVRVFGVRGSPPPPTTKLAVCLRGGWQAELNVFCVGLDTDRKVAQFRDGVLARLPRADFSTLSIEPYGSVPADPTAQARATVAVRVFAQAPRPEPLAQVHQAIFYNGLMGYAGLHTAMDWRTLEPRAYVRYFPVLVPQDVLPLQVHIVGGGGGDGDGDAVLHVPARPARLCAAAAAVQESREPAQTLQQVLPPGAATVRRPLGDLVLARSGDKGGNANIGFWVRTDAAYPWLCAFLTSARAQALLGDDWARGRGRYTVERCEFPHLRAVHFVVRGILQEGVSSSSIVDGLGKSVGEFMRARLVDLPADLVADEDRRREQAYAAVGRQYKV